MAETGFLMTWFIYNRSISKFSTLEEEDDFSEIFTAPKIKAATKQIVAPSNPDFSKVKVQELFHKLVNFCLFTAAFQFQVNNDVLT